MAQRKTHPRSVRIYQIQFENDLTATKIAPRSSGDVAQTTYTAMLKLEPQTEQMFDNLAARLNDLKKLSLNSNDLRYTDHQLTAEDNALRVLLQLANNHRFLESLNQEICTDEETSRSGIEMKPVGLVYYLISRSAVHVCDAIIAKSAKWPKKDRDLVQLFSDHVKTAIKERNHADGPPAAVGNSYTDAGAGDEAELRKKDVETRKTLIEYAINLLNSDEDALKAISGHLECDECSSQLAVQKLFAAEYEIGIQDNQLCPTFKKFMQMAFEMRRQNILIPSAILVGLRDIAICLSVPRADRLDAIRQSLNDSRFDQLPTADLEFAKLIVGRALGKLPGRKSEQISSGAIRVRILSANESVVELTLQELCGEVMEIDEPPDEGADSDRYLVQFCAGLAAGMGIDFSEEDKTLPPPYDSQINEHLDWYETLQVKICVFVTSERPEPEIPKLRSWFPNLDIIRLADTEPEQYRSLRTGADMFDEAFALNPSPIRDTQDS